MSREDLRDRMVKVTTSDLGHTVVSHALFTFVSEVRCLQYKIIWLRFLLYQTPYFFIYCNKYCNQKFQFSLDNTVAIREGPYLTSRKNVFPGRMSLNIYMPSCNTKFSLILLQLLYRIYTLVRSWMLQASINNAFYSSF